MTLRQLEYLTTVLDCGINLSSAARRLGVSQPNVSKQLALLEEEVGSPLFERAGKRLTSLTLTGRRIYHRAVKVTEELNKLNLEMLPQNLQNTLVIGLTPFTRDYVLPGMLAANSQLTEKLSLDLKLLHCEEITQAVREGRCDMGLIVGKVKPGPDLLLLPWYRWRYRMIFSRSDGNPKMPNFLDTILRQRPIVACKSLTAPSPRVWDALEKLGIRGKVDMSMPHPNAVKDVVRANGHVGIIAEMAYSEDQDIGLDYCESSPVFPTMMAWIAIRRSALHHKPAKRMLHAIAPRLGDEVIDRLARQENPAYLIKAASELNIPRYG